jgi:dTDP-4-dehydrorhamnose 3,5-epimerase
MGGYTSNCLSSEKSSPCDSPFTPVLYNGLMQITDTTLADVKLLRPRIFGDERGWFTEVFSRSTFAEAGISPNFVQDNQSFSRKGVLRGLHYQLGKPQGKLLRVLSGHIWDVAVDLRPNSPAFGKHFGVHLKRLAPTDPIEMIWIPEGFAHGFLVLSETAEVLYKTTDVYHPRGERCVLWNDPALGIEWPLDLLDHPPQVSAKDAVGVLLADADLPEAVELGVRE